MRPLRVVSLLTSCVVTAPCFLLRLCVRAHRRVRSLLVLGGGAHVWVCSRQQRQGVVVGVIARAAQGPFSAAAAAVSCAGRTRGNDIGCHSTFACVWVCLCVCLFVYVRMRACLCMCVCSRVLVQFQSLCLSPFCALVSWLLYASASRPRTPLPVRGVYMGSHRRPVNHFSHHSVWLR